MWETPDMNPTHHETVAPTRRLTLGLLLLAFSAGAAALGAESTPAKDETAPEKKPAAEAAKDPGIAEAIKKEVAVDADGAATQPEKAKPAPEKTPPGKPIGDGKREMTLDEIRDLPVLKRLDLPLEKGEAWLSDVKDKTFDYDESAFWWLVHVVAKLPEGAFKPDEMVTGYPQLLAMPSAHRGKPVTIRGAYMTVTPFTTPVLALRKDIPTLYECNIRELPLNEERPVATVIVIEDPMTYLEVFDTVRVKGYFYKVRRYRGSKGEGFAPMLVARRLELEQRAEAAAPSDPGLDRDDVVLGFMISLVVLLGLAFLWLRHRNKARVHAAGARPIHRFRLRRPDRAEPPPDPGDGGEGGEPQP